MSNIRLSAESSLFYQYNKNKSKKDLNPFVLPANDSSASDQESDVPEADVSASRGDGESLGDFNGFSPALSRTNTKPKMQQMSINGQENAAKLNDREDGELQLKGSFTRKPATRKSKVAVQTPGEKKNEVGNKVATKFNSDVFFEESETLSEKTDKKTNPPARNTEETTPKNPPPAKKRGKKNAENPSTETGNAPEPAAKRPRVASKRTKAISTAEPATASTEHADKDNILKNNQRGKKVSKIVDEVETDLSAGGSKNPTLRENKGRGRGRGRRKRDVSAECVPEPSSSSLSKSLDNHSRVEAKTPEAKNDEAHEMTLKTAEKTKERNYHFLSSTSESEVEDEEDDEDDYIFLSRQKAKSPKNAVPLPSFKTPTSVTNKVSELGSPKTSKFRLLPEPVPLSRTPRRTLTLVKEFSPNRVTQSISDAEGVADTELYKKSQKKTSPKPSTSRANEKSSEETPVSKRTSVSDSSKKPSPSTRLQSRVKSSQQLNDPENDIYGDEKSSEETPLSKRRGVSDSSKKPSPTKLLQSRVKSSQQLNDPENDIYGDEKSSEETPLSKRRSVSDSSKKPSPTKRLQSRVKSSQQLNDPENDIYGDDSGLIEAVRKITMLRSENSTNRQVPLRSAIDPSTLPVPNRSPLQTTFNFYLASPGDPIRAQQILSNAQCNVSWVLLLPKIVFPLKTNNRMMVMRITGSVEFRSDPYAPSRILLNSSASFVDLQAGRILHVVNTGEEDASFLLTEMLQ